MSEIRLLDHLRGANGHFKQFEDRIVREFSDKGSADKKIVWMTISSLHASGKTTFLKQWIPELQARIQDADINKQSPRIVRADFRDVVEFRNQKYRQENGKSTDYYLPGQITPEQYEELTEVEETMRKGMLDGLTGRVLVIYETLLVSETLDRTGTPVGTKRGNILGLKDLARDYSSFLVFIHRDENERRRSLLLRRDSFITSQTIAENFELQIDETIYQNLAELVKRGDLSREEFTRIASFGSREERCRMVNYYLTKFAFDVIGGGVFAEERQRWVVLNNP